MSLLKTIDFITNHPLNAGKPLSSIWRFIQWQLSSRINKEPVKKPFIQGTSLWMKNGWTGVTGNLYTGLHEYNDMAFLIHFLRAGDVFADVGANMGSYTVLASGVCKARSYTFEPVPFTFNRLSQNVALNEIEALVIPVNAAVGSVPGIIEFTSTEDTTNHIATQDDKAKIQVPIVTIDDTVKNDCPVLMKIDVEGYESEVIKGALQTLNNHQLKAIIIELNGSGDRYGYRDEDIHAKLLELNFKPYKYLPVERTLIVLETFGNENTLYCRDIHWIRERVKHAPAFKVGNKVI